MLRRLFFAIPDVSHTQSVARELENAGIDRSRMHAASRTDVPLENLPVASEAQRQDRVWTLDRLFWQGGLALFAAAVLCLVPAWVYGSPILALAALVVMVGSYLFGHWFFARVPHTHLSDMRVPIEHGEVVLMVDVPKDRLQETEHLVSRRHPEAEVGGVGWASPVLGT